uniref:Uncharacterized protein n=1 Tax=Ixodes ricinus TaxID=34613 RepID=A0A147BRP1_IXORI
MSRLGPARRGGPVHPVALLLGALPHRVQRGGVLALPGLGHLPRVVQRQRVLDLFHQALRLGALLRAEVRVLVVAGCHVYRAQVLLGQLLLLQLAREQVVLREELQAVLKLHPLRSAVHVHHRGNLLRGQLPRHLVRLGLKRHGPRVHHRGRGSNSTPHLGGVSHVLPCTPVGRRGTPSAVLMRRSRRGQRHPRGVFERRDCVGRRGGGHQGRGLGIGRQECLLALHHLLPALAGSLHPEVGRAVELAFKGGGAVVGIVSQTQAALAVVTAETAPMKEEPLCTQPLHEVHPLVAEAARLAHRLWALLGRGRRRQRRRCQGRCLRAVGRVIPEEHHGRRRGRPLLPDPRLSIQHVGDVSRHGGHPVGAPRAHVQRALPELLVQPLEPLVDA